MLWINKYKPKSLQEYPYDTDSLVLSIKKNKHIILHGPTGTGKTSLIHILAKQHDLEILELNASNTRNKEQIESLIGQASQQMSLFMKKKLILLDEIDSLSGTFDRGGIQAIAKILETSKHPIIMTCNDIHDDKIKALKKKCEIIELNNQDTKIITDILKKIADEEKIKYEEIQLKTLARSCNGDIRGAITDLQTHSIINNTLDLTFHQDRSPKQSIENALTLIFKSKSLELTSRILENTDIDLDTFLLWLDYNLPYEYTKSNDLHKAYEKISKSDIFKRRIIKRQYWRYLVYQNILLTAGIALSKDEKYTSTKSYKQTTRLLQIWRANMKNAKKKTIAQKIAQKTHTSTKDVLKHFNFYSRFIAKPDIINELQLSEDEIMWLNK